MINDPKEKKEGQSEDDDFIFVSKPDFIDEYKSHPDVASNQSEDDLDFGPDDSEASDEGLHDDKQS